MTTLSSLVYTDVQLANVTNLQVTTAASFGQANLAFSQANAAFLAANNAVTDFSPAFIQANTARDHANAAFFKANTAVTDFSPAFNQANAAYAQANLALPASGGTISGNLVVDGSLTVSGNVSFVDTETLKISDPLIYLAGNNYTSDTVDIGFIGNYVNATGSNVHTGIFRDATTKEYYVFEGYDAEPTNNHINPQGNNFTISVLNTTLKTSNLILGGVNAISTIGAAFNKANAALPNTSGAAFAGNLNLPTGNLAVGIASANAGAKLQVYNTTGNSELWITAGNGYDPTLRLTGEAGDIVNEGFTLRYDNSVGDVYFENKFAAVSAYHFLTSVVEALTINTDGKVGVGETNPQYILDVKGTANVSSSLLVNDMNVKPTIQAAFLAANTSGVEAEYAFLRANLAHAHANASFAKANAAIANVAGITTAGALIVPGMLTANGLTLTAQNGALEGGEINIQGAASYDDWLIDSYADQLRFITNSSNTDIFNIFNAGAGTVNFSIDGAVGIGTTSLSVGRALTLDSSSNYFGIDFKTSGTTRGKIIQEATGNMYYDAGANMYFRTNPDTARMTIASNGDVQIGNLGAATNTLRFLDVYNTDTGASAGAITRLVTANVAGTGLTSLDIVKYKNGAVYLNNNEQNTGAAFTSFGISGVQRLQINNSGITVTGSMSATSLAGTAATGSGASGTWGINVTGSAGSATTATNSTQLGGVAAANFVQGDGARGRSVSRTGGTANSLTDPSGFYFGNSVTGMPTTDWWTWNQSIGNSWVSPDGYGWQHAVSFWSDDIRIRRLQSGAWQPWTVMLHSGNYNSYAPTLTGTGASGTWGISVTGSAGSATTASQLGGVAASSYMRTDSGQTVSARHSFGASQTATLQNASGSLGGLEVYSAGASAAAFMSFHRPGAYASYFGIDTDNNFAVGGWSAGSALGLMKVGSFGVGTAASGTAGEIRATNNITAYYSDKRLKTNIKKIEFALEKVNQISGVTFQSNDEAAKYGYTDKKIQVGVIAQEIEAVLPEVVVPAPFDIDKDENGNEYSKSGQNYKTVQYEKLVPLLIEAIKEMSNKIENLENQIQEFKKS